MEPLDAAQLMDFGHSLAQDLMDMASANNIPPKDLIMGLTVAQKLLQSVLYPGRTMDGLRAELEGDATYQGSSKTLEGN